MMKKNWILLFTALVLIGTPCLAAPGGPGGPGMGGGAPGMGGGRPMMHAGISHNVGRPPMGGGHIAGRAPMGRAPMMGGHPGPILPPPRIYRPFYRPYPYYYYPTVYYPSTYYYTSTYPYSTYTYSGVEAVPATTSTVVVRDDYAGINTAANVINAAANVAATIRYLTW